MMQVDMPFDARHATQSGLTTIRRPELLVLTSVRFFAALEVVLLHTSFELGGDGLRALPIPLIELLTRGRLAVSFFFVLSGFILAYTYCDGENDLKTSKRAFWRARFARIYPLYFLGFVMDAPRVLAFFLGSAASLASACAKAGVAAIAYLTLFQAWHPRVTNTWNTPGWSLSAEAFFYAVFPGLLAMTKRWRASQLCWFAVALWSAPLVMHATLFEWHFVDPTSARAYTFWRSFPPLQLPLFVLGVAGGRLFLAPGLEPHRRRLRVLGVSALVLILLLSISTRFLPGGVLEEALGGPLFLLLILALASGAISTPNWLQSPTLVLLGRASYAVYILHQPFEEIFLRLARLLSVAAPSPALLVAYLLTVHLSCIALFLLFEDPMRRLISRPRRS